MNHSCILQTPSNVTTSTKFNPVLLSLRRLNMLIDDTEVTLSLFVHVCTSFTIIHEHLVEQSLKTSDLYQMCSACNICNHYKALKMSRVGGAHDE
jgi:hypothetical protein